MIKHKKIKVSILFVDRTYYILANRDEKQILSVQINHKRVIGIPILKQEA